MQAEHDIAWLGGVLQTTIMNPELPTLLAANGDGVLGLENPNPDLHTLWRH